MTNLHEEADQLDRAAAESVHFTDPRVRILAQARYRLLTGESRMQWLALGKDDPAALISEAKDWMRAAVGAGLLSRPVEVLGEAVCTWCGRTAGHVPVVAGPGVNICANCVELVQAVLADSTELPPRPAPAASSAAAGAEIRPLADEYSLPSAFESRPYRGGQCEDCSCCTAEGCANGPDGPIGARCVTNSLGESSCPCTCD